MANVEHLAILRQGIEAWSQWRKDNPEIKPDLGSANLEGIIFPLGNFNDANLKGASLKSTDLRKAQFSQAILNGADLMKANLEEALLSGADLTYANLTEANLKNAYIGHSTLTRTRFIKACLTDSSLTRASALEANFTGSDLTGACIQEWNIGSSTIFKDVKCDYVFLQEGREKRRPIDSNQIFAPGEFIVLVQKALDTVDLVFMDGIDWKAFFTSFQELRSQYPSDNISIQGLERKAEGFIVRLEVNQEADKAAIETIAKQLYTNQLQLMESQYRQQLHAKDREIKIYKQQNTNLAEVAKLAASRPITVEATAVVNHNEGPKYDQRGAQFAGGFAETVEGNQIGGVINNYGASLDEITRLITALRDQVQTFPPEQKDDALDLIDDIETDLKKPEPDPGRLGRKLKQLAAAGTAAATIAGGAAAFSGNLNDFTGNVLDLTNKLGVPIELVQPSQGTP